VHDRPHPPQCSRDVNVSVSQPLAASPSQSPRPGSQETPLDRVTHRPPKHSESGPQSVRHDPHHIRDVRMLLQVVPTHIAKPSGHPPSA